MKMFRFTIVALAAASLVGCAGHDRRLTSSTTQYLLSGGQVVQKKSGGIVDTVSYWDGDGVSGSPSITIDLREQQARFYRDGRLVGVSLISSGREGYDTPTGNFTIMQKSKDHVSNLYVSTGRKGFSTPPGEYVVTDKHRKWRSTLYPADMPFFMRLSCGEIGFHQGSLPGYPASHGCIRMPERMAEIFFANVSHGTPVRVVN